MVASEVTGRMPGQHRCVDAAGREIGHQTLVLGRLEEELGNTEVGQLELGGQEVSVAVQVG